MRKRRPKQYPVTDKLRADLGKLLRDKDLAASEIRNLTCGFVPILMGRGGGWSVAIDNDIIIIPC